MSVADEIDQLEELLALKEIEARYTRLQAKVQDDKSPETLAQYKKAGAAFARARQASRGLAARESDRAVRVEGAKRRFN